MSFFTSPTSNILSTSYTSLAMSRSDSRDSATSTSSTAYDEIRPRSSSSVCSTAEAHHHSRARHSSISSITSWLPSPYRSCLQNACGSRKSPVMEPSSYLSDDDLLLCPLADLELPRPTSTAAEPERQRELSTEEQIELLRQFREREDAYAAAHPAHPQQPLQHKPHRPRMVRFASEGVATVSSSRRHSAELGTRSSGKRRTSTLRRCS